MIRYKQIVEVWGKAIRETPWPQSSAILDLLSGKRTTYRERLDRQPVNYFGKPIPRIVIVRRNLERLKRGG